MQRNPLKSLLRNESGTTIVEFAIVAPIFFFMMFAVMEFGLLNFTQIVLETAVDQAGRNVMVNPGNICNKVGGFQSDVEHLTQPLINSSNISVTATPVGSSGTGGIQFRPDICIPNNGPPNTDATCPSGNFIEINGQPGYQGKGPACNGGTAGQLVELEANLPYPLQFPFIRQLFRGINGRTNQEQPEGIILITARTVIRSEGN